MWAGGAHRGKGPLVAPSQLSIHSRALGSERKTHTIRAMKMIEQRKNIAYLRLVGSRAVERAERHHITGLSYRWGRSCASTMSWTRPVGGSAVARAGRGRNEFGVDRIAPLPYTRDGKLSALHP